MTGINAFPPYVQHQQYITWNVQLLSLFIYITD